MRMPIRLVLVVIAACLIPQLHAGKIPEEFKKRLFDRYDQKQVVYVPGSIDVGVRMPFTRGVAINHYHQSVEIPKKVQNRGERIDDFTFSYVSSETSDVQRTETGERFRVSKFYVQDEGITFYLESLKASRFKIAARGERRSYGLVFAFMFPKSILEAGDYETVVKEINTYLLPVAEAQMASEMAKKVEIQPGMTLE